MSYSLRHRNVEIVETKKRSYKKKNLKPLNETVIINSNSTMLDISDYSFDRLFDYFDRLILVLDS